MNVLKRVEALTVNDLQANRVWKFTNDDKRGETVVGPVKRLPVRNLTGKLVGTQVTLANGNVVWALIGNVVPENARMTEHLLTISVENHGNWFTLSRYHDPDHERNGADALARFLGLNVDDVFPISYDISAAAKGNINALVGRILKEPRERLARSEIIAMAVP